MIFTQIAAFVVLVAVPVGAALYSAFAFFKKRKLSEWQWASFFDLYVLAALVVVYAACFLEPLSWLSISRTFHLILSSAGWTYLTIRMFAFVHNRQNFKRKIQFSLYGAIAANCLMVFCFVYLLIYHVPGYWGHFNEILFPVLWVIWLNRGYFWRDEKEQSKRRHPTRFFPLMVYIWVILTSTAVGEYSALFRYGYSCLNSKWSTHEIVDYPSYRGSSAFRRIFTNGWIVWPEECYCPEGRERLRRYEGTFCQSASENSQEE